MGLVSSVGMNFVAWNDYRGSTFINLKGANIYSNAVASLYASVYGTWNMVSIPDTVYDFHKTVVYPTASSSALWYDTSSGAYVATDPLKTSNGYWIKFDSGQTVNYAGLPIGSLTIKVASNPTTSWNMIGSISKSVQTSSILESPSGIVSSAYFKSNSSGGYAATTQIDPGMGIFVKVSQSGTLTLTASLPKTSTSGELSGVLDQFVITDARGSKQEMYVRNVGLNLGKTDAAGDGSVELPPPPPDGFFSARFRTGNYIQSISQQQGAVELPIIVSAAVYPVKINWDIRKQNNISYFLTTGDNLRRVEISGSGSLTIRLPVDPLVRVVAEAGAMLLPSGCALEQNFPNPFNPTTQISYSLPGSELVTLAVYDLLGRQVASLVDEVQSAGVKTIRFNADNLASGIYFYRLQAGSFIDVKKMLIMK